MWSDAMFERGNPFPWLDQRKYPWISLTNAAVYLSRRDSSGRSRAVYQHEWEPPFSLLFEWIDADMILVHECSKHPFEPIRKEELAGVPVRFPSYTLEGRLEVDPVFQPGRITYIECTHNLSRFKQAPDRYYVEGQCEPRWHDLKVASEQLVALLTGRLLRGDEAA
jgi:hypothetical protein